MPENRRHPHKPFEAALIEEYLGDHKIISVELLPHGKSNSNYKLVVDGETCVFRWHAGGTAERERTAMRLVEGLVSVPPILAAGPDWSLFSFVEGDHLSDHPECLQAAVRTAANIWTVTFPSKGWVAADGTITPFDFGGESDFMTAILKDPAVNKWLGSQAVHAITRIFAIEAERPTEDQPCGCLVHGDFNPSNILVKDGEVVAILDWEFSHSGGPLMDIANLVRNTSTDYHQDIRKGLESAGVLLPEDWMYRCEFDHIGSYLELLTTQLSDEFKQSCVDKIHRFIDNYG
ncbi:MAG: phosphotransferase [Sedimentisphaerales bacterium]|nr:phosphotransferase [Sedimentisphaerales bacterium]